MSPYAALARSLAVPLFLTGCSALLGADFTATGPTVPGLDAARPDAAPLDAVADPTDAAPRPPLKAVVTSRYNTFALFDDGTLWAWGGNTAGSLGVGDEAVHTRPVRASVFEAVGKVVAVATGEDHTCVLTEAGALYCLGRGGRGALGDGTATDSRVPLKVPLKGNVGSLATTAGSTCVRVCSAAPLCSAACWGENDRGQLGGSGEPFEPLPVAISGGGLSDPPLIKVVGAGGDQVCAVNGYGRVYCWGRNAGVPAASGDVTSAPAQVEGVDDAEILALGVGFGCTLKSDTSVFCWGRNRVGQLGRSSFGNPLPPGQVTGMTDVAQIAAGATSACAVNADGGLWCWGGNAFGQLGIGGTSDSNTRQRLSGVPAMAGVTAAASHACSWTADGAVYCWGTNSAGELGLGTKQPQDRPARVYQAW